MPADGALGTVLVISAALILKVPKLRDKVLPPIRSALSSLWSVIRDRGKRLELFGGNVASELLYALALGATCLAYGVNLNLAQLVFVNTSASVLSSLVPVPGGIGAAEASLAAGLIAMGVDESTAFAMTPSFPRARADAIVPFLRDMPATLVSSRRPAITA